jgi:hypothetical protein
MVGVYVAAEPMMPILRGVSLQVFARYSLGCGEKKEKDARQNDRCRQCSVQASFHSHIVPGPELRTCATTEIKHTWKKLMILCR